MTRIVCLDPGVTVSGMVALDISESLTAPKVMGARAVETPAGNKKAIAGARVFDSIRRVREQARALHAFCHEHKAVGLVAEISDEGAQSSAAATGMAYPKGMLACFVEMVHGIAPIWVKPSSAHKAVLTMDERRAIEERAKLMKYRKGKKAGKRKPGAARALRKAAIMERMVAKYPDAFARDEGIRAMAPSLKEAIADALACYEASRHDPILRALRANGPE